MSPIDHPHADLSALQEDFLQLLLPLRDRLAHYARAVARTRDDADDLISDTIVAALEGFSRLRDRDVFPSYLFRIASRLQKRRRWRSKLFGEFDETRTHTIHAHGPSPETTADVAMLYDALDKLSAAQREAVVLFEISGLSLDEIRTIQGGSLSGVKSRVSRGRRQLAQLLGARQDMPRDERAKDTPPASAARDVATRGDKHLIYSGSQLHG